MRKNPHVRICGGLGSATTLVYPTTSQCDNIFIFGITEEPDDDPDQTRTLAARPPSPASNRC